ncbi:MAG TPA: hypothetical protein GX743_06795 [Actinomycetales bacterium]|nr:hypothetical protein [Actinomycetales bacterium]
MNTKKMWTTGLALMIAVGALGASGCGNGGSNEPAPGGNAATQEVTEEATVDVADDLQRARQAVLDALADDDWAQVMLASDVDQPTVKYGLMVMPFVASDAASRVTGTVNVDGGNFVIEAESATTGQTWQIDQDGNITEKAE